MITTRLERPQSAMHSYASLLASLLADLPVLTSLRHFSTLCGDDEFEWDDRKARRNARAHAVTFELARLVFADPKAVDRRNLDETDEDRGSSPGWSATCC